MIYGEPPILLESDNNENVIITIFGNSGNVGNIVGFGAQQVILVRDDCVRKEISKDVGKQGLILTIVECKGLEFQDVLLYNFFGCSSQKNQWRVIYEFMKLQDLLDAESPRSFPTFNEAKHNVLCAQAMQVASSPEEWTSQGIKLFHEHNYEMATMCFERAGNTYWEKRTLATSLKAAADRIFGLNPEEAKQILKEAAEIFEAIGKVDSAASCFFDLGEYERAGRIYLEKFEESDLEKAGDCFVLAGCYELAADVYARGNFFSECLTVCSKGKLFDMGLQYIYHWKRHVYTDVGLVTRSKDLNKIEQEFLESCAHHCHELKDNKSMMKCVKAFHSVDLMRNFLKSLDCFDELLLLEEELGNFVDASNIAKLRGEILRAADLLQRAGNFKEASILTLNHAFSNSLWSHGSKGWPLKQFKQKDELLEKAKSLAKNDSNKCYDFVCTEADILSNHHQIDLIKMNQQFNASERHQSIRAEILSSRKILDVHLHSNASKYGWEDELVLDLTTYSEVTISKNQVSVETLVYFWNYWKDKILNVFKHLAHLDTQDVHDNDHRSYGEFCLSYFGVLKQYELQHNNLRSVYFLLISDAEWVREEDNGYSRRSGKLVSIDGHQLVSAAQRYWSSELLFVGMKVLKSLEALHKQSIKNLLSMFCQVKSLTHIYDVAKFLLDSNFVKPKHQDKNELLNFVKQSTENFFGYIFPLDCRQSLRKNMISLRETAVSRTILEEVIFNYIGSQNMLSYGKLGRTAVIILGSGMLHNELLEKVAAWCNGNLAWLAFLKNLCGKKMDLQSLQKFHGALLDTYGADWRRVQDYISPDCFLYLVERLLILLCCFKGFVLTTKSSFIEWLIHKEGNTYQTSSLLTGVQENMDGVFNFLVLIVKELLHNKNETIEWIRKSHKNVRTSHSLVVLRLVVIMCLLQLNFGNLDYLIYDLLGRNYITDQLPWEFCSGLHKWERNFLNVNLIAEAFKRIGNHLVIVSLGERSSPFRCPDAIFIDMKVYKCKEDILGIMFPKFKPSQGHSGAVIMEATNLQKNVPSHGHSGDAKLEATNSEMVVLSTDCHNQGKSSSLPSSNSASFPDKDSVTQNTNEDNLLMTVGRFWKTLEAFNLVDNPEDQKCIFLNSPEIKVDLGKCINLLTTKMDGSIQKNPSDSENKKQLDESASMLEEMKLLHAAFDASEQKDKNNTTVLEICKRLQSKRPTMEPILNQLVLQQSSNTKGKAQDTGNGIASGEKYEVENTDSEAGECSNILDDECREKALAPTINTSGSQGNRQETENRGAGKGKPKKKKKVKGGRKHK